ncbi:MAG: hypothetical protein LBJ95_02395 [Oscillospiraceae bacterium]|jgi:hypothetical protein|nr:hypothetical protein [Oscillospiraceae bacterium]
MKAKIFISRFVALSLVSSFLFAHSARAVSDSPSDTEYSESSASIASESDQDDDDSERAYENALPPEIVGPARELAGCFFHRLCHCLPTCSKHLLSNAIFIFRIFLNTLGKAITYGGAADMLAGFFEAENKNWFVGGAVGLAILEKCSDIANDLLKADEEIHRNAG